ncbi:MAG: envelope stress response membrane protein PspC [Deltaproteobacteria bacterium]|nr:envelope stress response membrane protein PspC [Deltaproteobacteria bacterium]
MKRHRGSRFRGGRYHGQFKRRFSRERFDGVFHGRFNRSRHGMILGVCKGIAEYFEFSVFWVRLVTFVLFLFTGFWPTAVLYFVAAFLMKPAPAIPIENEDEEEFYNSYVQSKRMAADRLKRRYETLERRIQRLEHTVTTPEFDWEERLNSET